MNRALNVCPQAATVMRRAHLRELGRAHAPPPLPPGGAARLKTTRQSSLGSVFSVMALQAGALNRQALGKRYFPALRNGPY